MTDDIVARLRVLTKTLLLGDFKGLAETTESAADEIERLREQLRLVNIDNFNTTAEISLLYKELERQITTS